MAHASGADVTNWVAPRAGDFTAIGGVTLTVNSGGKLNGTTGYYRSSVLLANVPGLGQDNAAIHYDVTEATTVGAEMGSASGGRVATITPRDAGNVMRGRLNFATNTSIATGVSSRNGFFGIRRSVSTGYTGSLNGTVLGTVTAASVAPTGQTQLPTFGVDNGVYSDGSIRFMRIGSACDEAALYAGWAEYRDCVLAGDARSTGWTYTLMQRADGLYPDSFTFSSVTVYTSNGGKPSEASATNCA